MYAQNVVLEQSDSHTSTFKKESLRVVAITSSIHGDYVQPFLPKIMNVVCKYLKDKDSSVRDTCSEALGLICQHVTPPEAKDTLSVYLKPLFLLMSEQVCF